MKIVVDLTALSYHMTGIERYASCVTEDMLKMDLTNEYVLIFRNEIHPIFSSYIDNTRVKAVVINGDNKVIFLQIILPINLYKQKADKYIFYAFTSPIFFKRKGIINTIHDMGAWDSSEAMTCFQKLYWRTTYRVSAKASEVILTVSEFSKGRICEILKYPKERVLVTYNGVYEGITRDYGYKFRDVQNIYQLPDKYIMTLSTLEPRKNMEILLKAFTKVQDSVDYDLVLVGRKGWKMDEILEKYNSKERIHITGFVEDRHVSVIYKNALCFVFPSLYEGFGIPPIEALAQGTPVIASDASAIPEILMEQVEYFHSNSLDELTQKLEKLDKNVANMPHELNDFQKNNYSFQKSAEKILRLIS